MFVMYIYTAEIREFIKSCLQGIREVGCIIKVGGTWVEGHLVRVSGGEIEHFVWG